MQKLGFYLTCLLMFLVPLGYLTRPHQWNEVSSQAGRGVTTAVALLVILLAMGSGRIIRAIIEQPRFLVMFLFALMTLGAAFQVSAASRGDSISVSIQLIGYLFLSLSIVSFDFTRSQIFWILGVLAFSGVLMCFLALVDYFEIASIPTMNDMYSVIKNEENKTRIKSLSGPFRSRTEFAAHVAFIIPILLCGSLDKSISMTKRAPIVVGAAIVAIASVISGSRGLYLGIAGAGLYIVFFNGQKKLLSYGFRVAVIAIIVAIGLAKWKPEIYDIVKHRISTITPQQIAASDADSVRINAFQETLQDLLKRPYGYGFTKVYLADYFRSFDTHSIYTELLRAAGPFGVVLIVYWAYPLLRRMIKPQDVTLQLPVFSGIVCFAVYGLTHSPWATNILWVMIGLAYSTFARADQHAVATASNPATRGAGRSPLPPRPARWVSGSERYS